MTLSPLRSLGGAGLACVVPSVRGAIARRILVNYRIDPAALAGVLPAPFEPKLVDGFAIGGICLIRLEHIRPAWLPWAVGVASENAAHRFAVDWMGGGERQEGVYIPRRDTSSRLNAFVGGRMFPGEHHAACFDVVEAGGHYDVALDSRDGETRVRVVGTATDIFPSSSVFGSLERASAFFERGSLGYSATTASGVYDGVELRCENWRAEPLAVESVVSSFFDDERRFGSGTVTFDCALLMRDIEHEWRGRPPLCASVTATTNEAQLQ